MRKIFFFFSFYFFFPLELLSSMKFPSEFPIEKNLKIEQANKLNFDMTNNTKE